jgi:hypothetical protein
MTISSMTVGEDDPITRLSFTRFNIPLLTLARMRVRVGKRRSGQPAGPAVDAAAMGGSQLVAEAFYAHRQPV